ncbi:MAG: hypothetical protein D6720_02225 [Gammaproteobacteria bacterium]|nr:MAG: hypothetical protein D6720_02225 [Gammaproteobacteria bacterium]
MSDANTDAVTAPSEDEPHIRMGDEWIPAHQVWARLETASAVTDAIDRFNERFPHLSSDVTQEVVPLVRQRLRDIELRMPKRRQETPDLAGIVAGLLEQMSPEEVLETLEAEQGVALNLNELIVMVGERAYMVALRREAVEYEANKILPEQTADIWNDLKRPAPGGGLWSRRKVEMVLQLPAE